VLDIDATLDAGTHVLITTAGATRFYRSSGAHAAQRAVLHAADGARLEWLPLETIAHSGCRAHNRLRFELAPGAEAIGWEILALGLPASGEAFERGSVEQQIELPGRWLERGVIDATDRCLLDSPLGLAGHRVIGTLWFAAGSDLTAAHREALVDAARDAATVSPLARQAGCSAPNDALVVLRVLAERVEPAMQLFTTVWARWRDVAWDLAACAPRVWRT
jgi:urease accessory protein